MKSIKRRGLEKRTSSSSTSSSQNEVVNEPTPPLQDEENEIDQIIEDEGVDEDIEDTRPVYERLYDLKRDLPIESF